MTAFERAREWFVAPPPPAATDEAVWYAPPPSECSVGSSEPDQPSTRGAPPPEHEQPPTRWQPPVPDQAAAAARRGGADVAPSARTSPDSGAGPATPDPDDPPTPAASVTRGGAGSAMPGRDKVAALPTDRPCAEAVADEPEASPAPRAKAVAERHGAPAGRRGEAVGESRAPAAVTSAAVLGRPGEVEPVAAALALALRRETRSKAATVALIGATLPEAAEGGGAARRLAARLEEHGLEAQARGRLAWVRLDPEDSRLPVAARRVTLVAAPAVLAVTAPRTAATDEALADQDLLVLVAADPQGPLAQLAWSGFAAGGGAPPVVTIPPLGRGPTRALARAGLKPAPSVRRLLEEQQR